MRPVRAKASAGRSSGGRSSGRRDTTLPVTSIYFNPDQIEGKNRALVGRRSAGEGFLRAYLAHGCGETIRMVCEIPQAIPAFEEKLKALGETRPTKVTLTRGGSFADAGCIFFPSPGFRHFGWHRQRFGPNTVSLVGITHTVATRRIVESLHETIAQPVEDWDAIICTSHAVKSVVERHLEAETGFFRQRFGARRVPLPRLPMIPLGVDAAAFAPLPGARERMRAQFGADEGAFVVLTVGRLTVVEKANPLPLFIALEQLAQATGREVHLWMSGWAPQTGEEDLHREGAAELCPSVKVTIMDGRDRDIRRNIWAGADVFTLPVDSIQETFGLVPVEAMAAGLPVVMPDWDGFRDTVVHGQTGFLVPTRMAPPGTGQVLARRFADGTDSYPQHLALVQAQVQVDVPAYRDAFVALLEPGLRARMGSAGIAHVRAQYDWAAVIPQYLDLARELEAAREAGVATSPPLRRGVTNPMEVDPYLLYADYPTAPLLPDSRVEPGQPADVARLEAFDKVSGRALYKRWVMKPAEALTVHADVMQAGPTTPAEIAGRLGRRIEFVMSAVLLLAKADLLRLPGVEPRRRRGS